MTSSSSVGMTNVATRAPDVPIRMSFRRFASSSRAPPRKESPAATRRRDPRRKDEAVQTSEGGCHRSGLLDGRVDEDVDGEPGGGRSGGENLAQVGALLREREQARLVPEEAG